MIAIPYVLAIVAANYSVFLFGQAVTVVNAFLFVGFDMVARDVIHQRLGMMASIWLSVAAGALSYVLNPAGGTIALASVVAFILAAGGDAVTYQFSRGGWVSRSNKSNIAGAAVDSIVFPAIAFGSIMPLITLGQFTAKVAGGALFAFLVSQFYKHRQKASNLTGYHEKQE